LGADQDAISPGIGHADIPASYLWSEGPAEILQQLMDPAQLHAGASPSSLPAREVYSVAHAKPWGWHIAAYLWTKSISAGLAMVAGIGLLTRLGAGNTKRHRHALCARRQFVLPGCDVGASGRDLKASRTILALDPDAQLDVVAGLGRLHPDVLRRGYGAVGCSAWWIGIGPPALLLGASIVLGAASAGYSAFLFAQAEGRDFWQSPLLLPHLLAQAIVAGAATMMAAANFSGYDLPDNLDMWLGAGLIMHLLMILGEVAGTGTPIETPRWPRSTSPTSAANSFGGW